MSIGPVTAAMIKSSETIEDNLVCKFCSTEEDFQIIDGMIRIAKEEDFPFLAVIPPEQKALLLIDSSKQEFIGFLSWMKDFYDEKYILEREGADTLKEAKDMCCGEALQIIYVLKSERRKGYASKLIKFWVENYADKTYDKFGVEILTGSPILEVLCKLGYAEKSGANYKPLKIYQVHSS